MLAFELRTFDEPSQLAGNGSAELYSVQPRFGLGAVLVAISTPSIKARRR